jgi:diguanylate cyclase (GGDEF)-like protein
VKEQRFVEKRKTPKKRRGRPGTNSPVRGGPPLEELAGWRQPKHATPLRNAPVAAIPRGPAEFRDLRRYLLAALILVSVSLLLNVIDRTWPVPNLVLASPIITLATIVICLVAIYRLREIKEGLVRTEAPSAKDPVTGLPDEQYFWLRLREEHKRMRRYGTPVSLVLIDVDDLASVNRQYGQACGNAVLAYVSGVLQSAKRAADVATWLSDDHFALIVLECDKEGASAFVRRFERYVSGRPATLDVGGRAMTLGIEASIGVATAMQGEASAEELVGRARRNLEAVREERDSRRERFTIA